MQFNPLFLAVRRPVAVSMFFLAISFLGIFSWFRIPVELLPTFSGDQLFISYYRPGSEPAVVEREILIPLESRIAQLPGVANTWGEIVGSTGTLNIEFESGSNYRIRELELRRIAAALTRTQPRGTSIRVSSQDTALLSRFVMSVQILRGDDSNVLRDLVEEQIQPRVEALAGVSQVFVFGGASREVTISLNADRCAELGVKISQVSTALRKSVQGLRYLGSTEEGNRRISVVLDGRPGGLTSLGEIRIDPHLPVLLRHVADIELATARQKSVSRVNGQASISLVVFKDKGANLVQLGRDLHTRLNSLREQFKPYGMDLVVSFDAAQSVAEQLDHLLRLAVFGFLIALLVLYLYLREIRAVAVVAIAVPVSLLTAGASLYLMGYSLNLITLFGLVIGVGMLVDNSIVVYEAVQRNLERGADPDRAAHDGIRRTIRAIITASATNAVVFLPLIYLHEIPVIVTQVLENIVPAILFPLAASLLVAIGLVPLLAQRLAAPAALARLHRRSQSRHAYGGAVPPQLARELFSGLLKVALRRPAPWIMGTFIVILLTVVIALPWVLIQSITQPASEASDVRIEVEFDGGGSLEAAGLVFERLEQAALSLDGVERVESNYQEDQGSVTIHLEPIEDRPKTVNAARVRRVVNAAVNGMDNVQLRPLSAGSAGSGAGEGKGFGDGASQIAISGPDMAQLGRLAEDIKQRLLSIPQVSGARVFSRKGSEELHIQANSLTLAAHRLNAEDALEALISMGREGQKMPLGLNVADGREIPLRIKRVDPSKSRLKQRIENLSIVTTRGVSSLGELTTSRRGVPPPAIAHHNGRRELRVDYRLSANAPKTGPQRIALEQQIEDVVHNVYRPDGYTVDASNGGETADWFKLVVIPILFLLYAVLAVSFESLTLPLLILVTVPLTIFGAIWALFVTGHGLDMMAAVGVVVLLGLSVNPAILLVDRMQQQRLNSRCTGGTAAMTAVRERVRPVLMTACTSIAGLWPLALAKGQELEVWPPFATVVMGGLVTSTLLTLLIIPIGFVMLSRIDGILSRMGAWVIILWMAATAVIMTPLIMTEQLVSLTWQVVSTCLTAALLFWLLLRIFHRQQAIEIDTKAMVIETRYLGKIYGQAGPVVKAWQRCAEFSRQFRSRNTQALRESTFTWVIALFASLYLATASQTLFWRVVFAYVAGAFFSRIVIEVHRLLRSSPSLLVGTSVVSMASTTVNQKSYSERSLLLLTPWIVLTLLVVCYTLLPIIHGEPQQLLPAVVVLLAIATLLIQCGRHNAAALVTGLIHVKVDSGRLQGLRSQWRELCQRFFSWGLKQEAFTALSSINFRAEVGMIGILGPNGSGKTTLLRLLASILDASVGTIHYGGVEKRKIGRNLAKLIGFLPQEFGLPNHLTGREYLDYFALLHELGNRVERNKRVEKLIIDVGLAQKQHEKIVTYSGGMRQRLAVARTLLHEPPVIIVDEPTVGLDPRERIHFRNLLVELSKGRIVLFSTHVVEDVAVSCDRVLVLKAGGIIYDGKPKDLAQRAKGKIWQVDIPQSQRCHFEKQYKVINQMPGRDGLVCLRVLADCKPHQHACSAESSLEDGYLQLLYGAAWENG